MRISDWSSDVCSSDLLGNMLDRCTGQVDVSVHIAVFGMAEINEAGEGHHEARAERFALECDPAQFLSGQIAPGLWIVAPVFPIGIGKLREQYAAAADMPLDGLQSFGGLQYAVIDIEDRHILCFDQHPAIIEGHCAACYID